MKWEETRNIRIFLTNPMEYEALILELADVSLAALWKQIKQVKLFIKTTLKYSTWSLSSKTNY